MRSLRHPVSCLLLTWYLIGCGGGWVTRPIVPQEEKRTIHAGDVRVRTIDGITHRFRGIWVSQDSLGGWLAAPAGAERSFPLASIERVEYRTTNRSDALRGSNSGNWKAAVAVIGGIVVVAAAAIFVWLATADCIICDSPAPEF